MSSFFPALDIKQPEGPLQQLGGVMQLKALQGQIAAQPGQLTLQQQKIEAQQRELNDQAATTAAMKEWAEGQGKIPQESLPDLILKHGGSSDAYLGMKQKLIDQQTAIQTLDKDKLANAKAHADAIGAAAQAVLGVSPENRPQAYALKIKELQAAGIVSQQEAQQPYDEDIVKLHAAGAMTAQQQLDTEINKRKAAAEELTAQSRADTAKTGALRLQAELPGGPLYGPAKAEAEATNPKIQQAKIDLAAAEGTAKAKAEQAIAAGGDEAVKSVPAHLIPVAKADAAKAGQEYADAKSVSDRMAATMDAARKGNVISYQIIPEEGTLQITTSQGVHRINKTEVDQYAGGGSLWQRMQGHFGKALTGQSIPESVLKDMADIQQIQAQGARARYENKLKNVNAIYGSKFKPVEMEGLKKESTQADPLGIR